jgi:hypothetical protein
MDHVLDKGIVIETARPRTPPGGAGSTGRIAVFGVDARVEIATDLGGTWGDASTGEAAPAGAGRVPRAGRRGDCYTLTRCTYP